LLPEGVMAKKNPRLSIEKTTRAFEENVSRSGSAAGASYTLIGAMVLLGGIGYAIDRWQGTSPWCLLAGLVLGVMVGFYELVKTTRTR
jgi:F0F1-type ATP synthase assembly protein I